ncbi:MAG: cupin, partial [Pseudolabrys sp.]|nr:cupin [Pseudolabrys sp.]
PGDVAVLPAGTGHQRLSDTGGLVVIGGYPPDGTYDLCRGDHPADRIAALKTILDVAKPLGDPVAGRDGPLTALWKPA